jgi:hypothetical protein
MVIAVPCYAVTMDFAVPYAAIQSPSTNTGHCEALLVRLLFDALAIENVRAQIQSDAAQERAAKQDSRRAYSDTDLCTLPFVLH